MQHEIHMYMAVGLGTAACGALSGERHPMLVFLRQPAGADHDLETAAQVAAGAGWAEVDITKAGILPPDVEREMDPLFASHHATAMRAGWSLLVYDAVVSPAPEPKTSAG